MQLLGRILLALAVSAVLIVSCNLNPQPEPPSALDHGGSNDSNGGAGGSPSSTGSGAQPADPVSFGDGTSEPNADMEGSPTDRDLPDGAAPTSVWGGRDHDAGAHAATGDSGADAGRNAGASDAAQDDTEED